jgi:hypothetical protein
MMGDVTKCGHRWAARERRYFRRGGISRIEEEVEQRQCGINSRSYRIQDGLQAYSMEISSHLETPENGWGIEIAGVNYSNNHDIYEVIVDPLKPITHTVEGDCITVEWEGSAAGVIINVKYHLTKTDLFYTTEVTLTNTTLFDLTDVYYYRNVDPDNNQSIGGSHTTTNTIVSQPSGDCQKALVSATQVSPRPSFMGFRCLW